MNIGQGRAHPPISSDSLLEGNGFELSVPRCPADSAGAFMRRRVGSSSRRNRSIGFAEADDCSDDTAAPTVDRPQTRTKPRTRYLSRAELKFESIPLQRRVGTGEAMRHLLAQSGIGQIVIATDYPFSRGTTSRSIMSCLSDDDRVAL